MDEGGFFGGTQRMETRRKCTAYQEHYCPEDKYKNIWHVVWFVFSPFYKPVCRRRRTNIAPIPKLEATIGTGGESGTDRSTLAELKLADDINDFTLW